MTGGEQSVSRAGSLALSIVIPVYNGARTGMPTNSTDEREEGKTNRDDVADQLIGDQHDVFPGDERVEFALAVLTLPEVVGQLLDPQRRRQDIEEDLDLSSPAH